MTRRADARAAQADRVRIGSRHPAGGHLDATTGQMTGWEVHGRNLSGSERYMRAYVICVPKTV